MPAFPPTRGDRGAKVEKRFCSGVRVEPPNKFAWLVLGGGCTDLALVALVTGKLRFDSEPSAEPPSIERLAESRDPVLSPNRLGRLACPFRVAASESVMAPGPMDLRGGRGATAVFETGGYWL